MDIKQFESQINEYVENIYEQIREVLEDKFFTAKDLTEFVDERKEDIVNSIFDSLVEQLNLDKDNPFDDVSKAIQQTNDKIINDLLEYSNKTFTEISNKETSPSNKNPSGTRFDYIQQNVKFLKMLNSNIQMFQSKLDDLNIESSDETVVDTIEREQTEAKGESTNTEKINFKPVVGAISLKPVAVVETIKLSRMSLVKKLQSQNKIIDKKLEYLDAKGVSIRDITKKNSEALAKQQLSFLSMMKQLNGLKNSGWDVAGWVAGFLQMKMKLALAKHVKDFLGKFKLFKKFFGWIDKMKRTFNVILRRNSIIKPIMKMLDQIKAFKSGIAKGIKDVLKNFKSVKFIVGKWQKLLLLKGKAAKLLKAPFKLVAGKLAGIGAKLSSKLLGKGLVKIVGKFFTRFASKGLGKIPVLGGVVDAWFAYDRFKKGDYLGATLQLIAGLGKFAAPIPVVGQILYALSWAIDLGLLALDANGETAGEFFSRLGSKHIAPIIKAFAKGEYWEATKMAASLYAKAFTAPWNAAKDLLMDYYSWSWNLAKKGALKAWEFTKDMWDKWSSLVLDVRDKAIELGKKIVQKLGEMKDAAVNWLGSMVDKAKNFVKEKFNKVYTLIEKIPVYVQKVKDFKDKVAGQVQSYINDRISIVKNYYDAVIEALDDVGKDIKYIIESADIKFENRTETNDIEVQQDKIGKSIEGKTLTTTNSEVILKENKAKEYEDNEAIKQEYDYFKDNPEGITYNTENIQDFDLPVPGEFKSKMEELRIQLKYLTKMINNTN